LELGDLIFFKSPFSKYILQIKVAMLLIEKEIEKLGHLK
jgi:hypothetical protein